MDTKEKSYKNMIYEITEEQLDMVAHIECGLCKAKVRVATIKNQMKEGLRWQQLQYVGGVICAYCWKNLQEKQPCYDENMKIPILCSQCHIEFLGDEWLAEKIGGVLCGNCYNEAEDLV